VDSSAVGIIGIPQAGQSGIEFITLMSDNSIRRLWRVYKILNSMFVTALEQFE
jgi:hypothetical protein